MATLLSTSKRILALTGVVLALGAAPVVYADGVADLASVLASINHYPSDAQKTQLAALAADETQSQATRTLATALANFAHQVQGPDRDALTALIESDTASDQEKQLASIALEVNHVASEEEKAVLINMANTAK